MCCMKTYVPLKRTHFFKLEETKKKQGPLTKYRAQLIHLAATPCLHGCTPKTVRGQKKVFPQR